jgi:short-subunit dehydrogenase
LKNLKNKLVCITGASSGIGEALAYAFANEGSRLLLCARSTHKLHEVKANCTGAASVDLLSVDLSKYEDIDQHFDSILSKTGDVDVLINNAGISQRTTVIDSTLDVDKKIMDINYFGLVALTRYVLPSMIKRQSGHLVAISSVAGYISTSHRSAYAASKHAVRAWYDSLRSEVYKDNVKVTVICPGYINTDISKNALNDNAESYGKMDANQAKGMTAEECASKIVDAIKADKSELLVGGKETRFVLIKRLFPSFIEKKLRSIIPK